MLLSPSLWLIRPFQNPQGVRQADAALMLVVDALESGDRALFNQALSIARWVAEEDQNPRLLWHVHTVAAGAAHLDDDLETAVHHRNQARSFGESINAPGWIGADMLLLAEEILSRKNPAEMAAIEMPDDFSVLSNPIGRLTFAYFLARSGTSTSLMWLSDSLSCSARGPSTLQWTPTPGGAMDPLPCL